MIMIKVNQLPACPK